MTTSSRLTAQDIYHNCETHGEILDVIQAGVIYKNALDEIDELLIGQLPFIKQAKDIIATAKRHAKMLTPKG